MTDLILRAVRFATNAHEGRVHRDGRPAIEHSLAVAENFRSEPVFYAVAVLHDVLEDCEWILPEHIEYLFGPTIADAVVALSRRPAEPWSVYIRRVEANPIALLVKIKDIEHNISRGDEQMKKKIGMYREALSILSHSPTLSCTEEKK